MSLRRLPPLAIAFTLMAAALVATTLATRHSVKVAFVGLGDGQALIDEQLVRSDIGELEGPPSTDQLAAILKDRADEGVQYIGLVDNRAIVIAEAGTPKGPFVGRPRAAGRAPGSQHRGRPCRRAAARRDAGSVSAWLESERWPRAVGRDRGRSFGGARAACGVRSHVPDRGARGVRDARRGDRGGAQRIATPARRSGARARAQAREPGRDVGGARARDQEPTRVAQGATRSCWPPRCRKARSRVRKRSASSTKRCDWRS